MIVILDYGSQYTQLIARRVREQKVYCEILPWNSSVERIRQSSPLGLILSGGPASVNEDSAPTLNEGILDLGIPLLGICYGKQVLVKSLGGKVRLAGKREFGLSKLTLETSEKLFDGIEPRFIAWMSHGDEVEKLPPGFIRLGKTANAEFAAIADPVRKIFGLQFHPEVHHTIRGSQILANFVLKICGEPPLWTMESFVEKSVADIRETIGDKHAICALSGGVDSSVVASLAMKAIGQNLHCVFVDNGLLREGESQRVEKIFSPLLNSHLTITDAREDFLKTLSRVTDPEEKRKRIGRLFIEIFEREAKKIGRVEYLFQGTLYPDVIESVSVVGPSATIKTHHNVGGLPEKMNLKLVEPLRFLFKDEVRELGRTLELPGEMLNRHPFPGPGLAVRLLGEITEEGLQTLRKADQIVEEEIRRAGLYDSLWQAFAVLLPIKTVGVMGDSRTYENAVVIRCVESQDAMTADWAMLPKEVLGSISNRIINEVRGVNRVAYDITSKPPGTIEWE